MDKFELKEILEQGVVTVVFTKVDGTERMMQATLLSEFLPQVQRPQLLTEEHRNSQNDDLIHVWDVEASGFRSIRISSIKEVGAFTGVL